MQISRDLDTGFVALGNRVVDRRLDGVVCSLVDWHVVRSHRIVAMLRQAVTL